MAAIQKAIDSISSAMKETCSKVKIIVNVRLIQKNLIKLVSFLQEWTNFLLNYSISSIMRIKTSLLGKNSKRKCNENIEISFDQDKGADF